MQITSINYQKTFNIGSYQSLKLGAEMSINEGENAEEGMEILRLFVHEYFTKHAPTEAFEQTGEQVRDIGEVPPKDPKQALIHSIESCKELDGADGLLSFKRLAENDAEIKAVYDLQLLKLKK